LSSQEDELNKLNASITEENEAKDKLLKEMQSAIETLFGRFKQETHKLNSPEHLADGQIFLLFNLCQKGICNASDVANMIGITSGAVTGMTDKLVSLGLITRERSEQDRRVVLFSITEKGKEVIGRIREKRFSRINDLFKQITNDELETTIKVFNKITALMDQEKHIRREKNDS
jgi:DNA-binding MarR family transcriptional regulator